MSLSEHQLNRIKEVYIEYVKEILNLTDIKRWSSKKTLSETTYTSQRTNETKIIDAIKGTDYKQNDRIWVYFDKDQNLKLVEHYKNDHDMMTLIKKLFTVSRVFDMIITKGTFINYSLKKNQALLGGI